MLKCVANYKENDRGNKNRYFFVIKATSPVTSRAEHSGYLLLRYNWWLYVDNCHNKCNSSGISWNRKNKGSTEYEIWVFSV